HLWCTLHLHFTVFCGVFHSLNTSPDASVLPPYFPVLPPYPAVFPPHFRSTCAVRPPYLRRHFPQILPAQVPP
ncbi:hypothetical protein L9F63_027299, partial [Diploptera punctata]